MSAQYSRVEKQRWKFLTAVSSLKRAAGIPDHPFQGDSMGGDDWCSLYTTDPESAHMLSNLMGSILIAPHTEKYWSIREDMDPRYFLKIKHEGDDIYQVKFALRDVELRQRTELVKKLAQKLIAPDSLMEYRSR